ncbi:hypothetical protein BGZ63DRAFT_468241 [Mariannaea sp. PMI_226]|nr:hypothetical protein BGZ63DRAFT_468241 [Mariannaea sp. PMI_226]
MIFGSLILPVVAFVASGANAQSLRVWTGVRGGSGQFSCAGDSMTLLAGDTGKCFNSKVITCWQVLEYGDDTLSMYTGQGCSGEEVFTTLVNPIGQPQSTFKTYHSYRFNKVGLSQVRNSTEDIQSSTEDIHGVEKRQNENNPSGQSINYNGRVYTLGQFVRYAPVALRSITQSVVNDIGRKLSDGEGHGTRFIDGELLEYGLGEAPGAVPPPVIKWMWQSAASYANSIGVWHFDLGLADTGGHTLAVLNVNVD